MKYIYGLNKSGLSLIHHLSKTSESFIAWDDNEKRRLSTNAKNFFDKKYNLKLQTKKIEKFLSIC